MVDRGASGRARDARRARALCLGLLGVGWWLRGVGGGGMMSRVGELRVVMGGWAQLVLRREVRREEELGEIVVAVAAAAAAAAAAAVVVVVVVVEAEIVPASVNVVVEVISAPKCWTAQQV